MTMIKSASFGCGLAVLVFVSAAAAQQPPGGFPDGPPGGFPGGQPGGMMVGPFQPGQAMPTFLQEQLKLTAEQKKKID